MNKRLESLRQRVNVLKGTVEALRVKTLTAREERKKATRKQEIIIYLDSLIIPYLEGVSERFNEPLEAGIKRLIKKKSYRFPTRYRRGEALTDIQRFLSTPQARVLISVAGPAIRWKTQQLADGADFILDEVLNKEYPTLYEAIAETEGGREWFQNMLNDMVHMVRRLVR